MDAGGNYTRKRTGETGFGASAWRRRIFRLEAEGNHPTHFGARTLTPRRLTVTSIFSAGFADCGLT
jgi:hypothetical protein